jgi:hypothetical protein
VQTIILGVNFMPHKRMGPTKFGLPLQLVMIKCFIVS